MKKFGIVCILCCLFMLPVRSQSVGLVLSGGGAKGIAHIGIIQALEENNVPIDYIAGTSMGAIVGAWYAMGYTPKEMIELIQSDDFGLWSRGIVDKKYVYYFKKPDPTPEMGAFNISVGDSVLSKPKLFPTSLINPLPMNFAFMDIFSVYTAQSGGNFDNLFVPFRCVASDVYNKRAMILRDGDLGDAVRASMSFPFVFKPIEKDGVLVYDGGIYNNFPVDVMKADFNPDIIIGSVVASDRMKPAEDDLVAQIEGMVMQKSDYSLDPDDGILMKFDLSEYGLLDFPKADAIYRIGYDRAISLMDSIKTRIPREIKPEVVEARRSAFRTATPELVFDSISVEGTGRTQGDYIRHQFPMGKGVLSVEQAKEYYYKTLSDGKISDLIPSAIYNPSSGHFTLNMRATAKDQLKLGIGGYLSSSNTNLLYLGAHYRTVSLYSLDLDLSGQIGQSYMSGELSGRIDLPTRMPMYLKLTGVLSNQKFYESDFLFYEDRVPTFISQSEYYIKLRLGLPFMSTAKAEISTGYGYLTDAYYQSNVEDYSRYKSDKSTYSLGMISLNFEQSSLDRLMYPSSGRSISLLGEVVYGKGVYNPARSLSRERFLSWLQIKGNAELYFPFGNHFTLGVKGEALLSSKGLFSSYASTIVQAPAFTPTPHSQNTFHAKFRANQYVAAGLVPIWKIWQGLQLRGEVYCFAPLYRILEDPVDYTPYYGKLFDSISFMGELSLVYNFPFASASVYLNYYDNPGRQWNVGVSFGLLILSRKFL